MWESAASEEFLINCRHTHHGTSDPGNYLPRCNRFILCSWICIIGFLSHLPIKELRVTHNDSPYPQNRGVVWGVRGARHPGHKALVPRSTDLVWRGASNKVLPECPHPSSAWPHSPPKQVSGALCQSQLGGGAAKTCVVLTKAPFHTDLLWWGARPSSDIVWVPSWCLAPSPPNQVRVTAEWGAGDTGQNALAMPLPQNTPMK